MDSSVLVAIILDRMGLERWQLRMQNLTVFKPDCGKVLTILERVFKYAEGKQMLDGSGVIWTWSRTAWESLDTSWIKVLQDEAGRIPHEHITILGDDYES